jgi:hypothetical protein
MRWNPYGGRAALMVIAVASLMATGFLVGGYSLLQSEAEYWKNGVAANATVTRKDVTLTTGVRSQSKNFTVSYRYQDGQGQGHEGSSTVGEQLWNRLQNDQALPIEYLRDQPARSQAIDRPFLDRWNWLFCVGIGSLLVGCLVGGSVGVWIWAGRHARLVRDGVPFVGLVTEHDDQKSGHRLRFTFTDATATRRSGTSWFLSPELMSRWPVNKPILVLQDPSNPTRFEADIFGTRADELARLRDLSP